MRIPNEKTHTNTKLSPAQQRLIALAQAEPETLAIFDRVLAGESIDSFEQHSLKLLTFKEAAEKLNLARSTVERMVADGIIQAIVLRRGRRRIREADLYKLVFETEDAPQS
ncbi:MAG: helix-turn-helix domain-containing protein [Verrucomicrobia bacterium]|nr:helix-turn-helix domain-containing protein [Verrucomicrobiota bacterium]MCH8511662.1 helix-turn-helix domain-containing protein [Kiritimatiellia bacterium]